MSWWRIAGIVLCFLLLCLLMLIGAKFDERVKKVSQFRECLWVILKLRAIEDRQAARSWHWRYYALVKVSFIRMLFSFKPVKVASFYQNTAFLQPQPRKASQLTDSYDAALVKLNEEYKDKE